jgi:hypothetical protein
VAASASSVGSAHCASRVALTVEGAVRVRMPLHGVPLCLCVCGVSSAIVDITEADEQDCLISEPCHRRGKSRRLINNDPRWRATRGSCVHRHEPRPGSVVWGHADIVQVSMTHPDGQPRAGLGVAL